MIEKLLIGLILLIFISASVYAITNKMNTSKKTCTVFETSLGNITCILYPKQAPITVKNFIGLAKGDIDWIDPRTNQKSNAPLYDGTIFHRVIPDFMIQGGDPLGQGIGGPGYKFEDEIDDKLNFDKPGMLAMANSGPATNGSQFFITVAPAPWLKGHHTIFGKVVKGQDIVDKISLVQKGDNDKPITPVILIKLTIKDRL